jgi:hypothetical protein
VLPDFVERLLSLLALSSLTPLLNPIFTRVSSFDVLGRLAVFNSRSGFFATLGVIAFVIGYRRITEHSVRALISRIVVAEALIFACMIAVSLDNLPALLVPSGAWQALPVLLMMNVAVTWLILTHLSRDALAVRGLALLNLFSVAVWLSLQLGFVVISEPRIELPQRNLSWFDRSREFARDEMFTEVIGKPTRTMFADTRSLSDELQPLWQNFLLPVSLGVPVVAPSDPKIRTSNHLARNWSFNHTIFYWNPRVIGVTQSSNNNLTERETRERIELTTDFLQVEHILVDDAIANNDLILALESSGLRRWVGSSPPSSRAVLGRQWLNGRFQLYVRDEFHAFTIERGALGAGDSCPVLQQQCPILEAPRTAMTDSPRLTRCEHGSCLWRYQSPVVASGQMLVIPITYDGALRTTGEWRAISDR